MRNSLRRGLFGVGLLAVLSLAAMTAPAQVRAQLTGREDTPHDGPARLSPQSLPGVGITRLSLATTPCVRLAAELHLSDKQKQAIAEIQEKYLGDRYALKHYFPRDLTGGPKSFAQMRVQLEKERSLEEDASKQIDAWLTDDQRKAAPEVLKVLEMLATAGIPINLPIDLKLSSDQKSSLFATVAKSRQELNAMQEEARQKNDYNKIHFIFLSSQESLHRQVMAMLSETQKTAIDQAVKEYSLHRR